MRNNYVWVSAVIITAISYGAISYASVQPLSWEDLQKLAINLWGNSPTLRELLAMLPGVGGSAGAAGAANASANG